MGRTLHFQKLKTFLSWSKLDRFLKEKENAGKQKALAYINYIVIYQFQNISDLLKSYLNQFRLQPFGCKDEVFDKKMRKRSSLIVKTHCDDV